MTWLLSIPNKILGYALAALAIVGLVFGIRMSGVNSAKRKLEEKQRKADDATRKRIEKTKPADSAADARDKLRKRKPD